MASISIRVDDRECRSAAFDLLQRSPEFEVSVAHLKRGDYLVDGRLLFERKTMPDLAASIIDGRLFVQALSLAQTPLRCALIVEGTAEELAPSGMRREAIQGALVTVSLFCGVAVLFARTPEETVKTMQYAARQGQAVASGALPRRGWRPKGKRARQLYILQSLPGIGPARAQRLLDRFGSVEAVMTADSDRLCVVPGIGAGIAKKLRWALEQPRSEYRARSALT